MPKVHWKVTEVLFNIEPGIGVVIAPKAALWLKAV